MDQNKPITTFVEFGQKLITMLSPSLNKGNFFNKFSYKEVVGSLVFAMSCTKPNINYNVMHAQMYVSQHLQNPTNIQWTVLK